METVTQNIERILANLEANRSSMNSGDPRAMRAARHFSLAITSLEEALMHRNRAEAILMGVDHWWDPESDKPRY